MNALLDPQSLRERLAHLGTLQQGWFGDDDGKPIDAGYLQHVGDVLSRLMAEHRIIRPYIYPTPEGLVECEWDCARDKIFCVTFTANRSVDVLADDGEWHCAYATSNDAVEFIAEHAKRAKLETP